MTQNTTKVSNKQAISTLLVVALFAFVAGNWFFAGTHDDDREKPFSPGAGFNVDEASIKRIVLKNTLGMATNWGSTSGRERLVFFGYTFCPDICPMGMSHLSEAVDLLATQGIHIQPIFVTVDPKRDTAEVLQDYIAAFHEKLIGFTGREEQIQKLAQAFKAYFETPAGQDEEYYLVDHTSFIYLVGRDGEVMGYFPESLSAKDLFNEVQKARG